MGDCDNITLGTSIIYSPISPPPPNLQNMSGCQIEKKCFQYYTYLIKKRLVIY